MTAVRAGGPVPVAAPRVSVVIPAFNARAHVCEAIASVLGQTMRSLECIVVDDGSTDNTAAVIAAFQDPRLRYIRQPNCGVSRARNVGVEQAQGEFVAFLDADDVWLPSKLERQLEVLDARPDIGAVLVGYVVTDERLRPRWEVSAVDPERRLREWLTLEGEGPSLPSTVLLRRSALDDAGGFDDRFPPSEDLHFAVRLSRVTRLAAVPACLSLYRTHVHQHHRELGRLEANVLDIFDDLLSAPESAALRRRATANLYTRLLFRDLRRRDLPAAATSLRRAWSLQPNRLLLLPLRVGGRRLRERLGTVLLRPPTLAQGSPERRQPRGDVALAGKEA